MSEITKLYENAGISRCCHASIKFDDCIYSPSDCGNYNYPDFTAEKQINLIIFLANREIRISPTYISSGYYLNNLNKIKSSRNISTFENSLAQHINAIWQSLTEEEKQQVKGILE